jgi:hypothetical protein
METQEEVCARLSVELVPAPANQKLGIALKTIGSVRINGVRLKPENGTCGWFIWCGTEVSSAPDFYQPLHVAHIEQYLPSVEPYLGLPPGYRFLIEDGYEDVWFDESLLSG